MVGTKEGLVILSVAMILIATGIMIWVIVKAKGNKSAKMVPWLIWSAVTGTTVVALQSAHATLWEQAVPISQLFSMFVIMLATAFVIFTNGGWRKERIRTGDGLALAISGTFVVLGLLLKDPYVTLWGNFGANIIGLVPLYFEGRADPGKVTHPYWTFRGFSTSAATAACLVDGLSTALLIPSVAGLIIVGAMKSLKLWPKQARAPRPIPPNNDPHPFLSVGTLSIDIPRYFR